MDHPKGNSIFSYNLTRQYPFRWFNYAAIGGGAVLAVLFSFVALAADGYSLEIQYVPNLNETLKTSHWYEKPPFTWVSQTRTSCQPALLNAGSTVFTTNLGFTYTLDSIWRAGHEGIGSRLLPATPYQNVALEECQVRQISINFARRDFTSYPQNYWSWGATTASGTVTCMFATASGYVKANLTTQLPERPDVEDSNQLQQLLLSTNVSDHANMWFGSEITSAWYLQLPWAMGYAPSPVDTSTVDSGVVVLYPNPQVSDYTDLAFFHCSAVFLRDGGLAWMHSNGTVAYWADSANWGLQLPNITTTIDTFGKVLYSLLLSEFGVLDTTNALLTPEGVRWLGGQVDKRLATASWGTTWYSPGHPINISNAFDPSGPQYPMNKSYDMFVDAHGGVPPNLNSTRAPTLFAQYLCSIPQRKAGGALFFAILLADLVFLQAVWTLLNLGATSWLQRKYKALNYCEGCRSQEIPLLDKAQNSSGGAYKRLSASTRRSSDVTGTQAGDSNAGGWRWAAVAQGQGVQDEAKWNGRRL